MNTCPKCGRQFDDDADQCPVCGTEIEAGTEEIREADQTGEQPTETEQPAAGSNPLAVRLGFVVFLLIGLLYVSASLMGKKETKVNTGTPTTVEVTGETAIVTPNSAGDLPTPEPLIGMDSPVICKMEMGGINQQAQKVGASGILVLTGYDVGKDICQFEIQSMTLKGVIGTVSVIHHTEIGSYGITLEVDKAEEEMARLWSQAAILYLNNAITAEVAETAMREAMDSGSAESELFRVSISDTVNLSGDKPQPVRRIEILNLPPEE